MTGASTSLAVVLAVLFLLLGSAKVLGAQPMRSRAAHLVERKPHARTMIRLAKVTGMAMTDGGELGNLFRRLITPHLRRLPGFHALVTTSETPPLHRSDLILRSRLLRGRVGRLVPNAVLDDGRRYDDVVAGRYAIVTTVEPTSAQRAQIRERGGILVIASPASELCRWLRRGHTALVRPDGTVQRTGTDLSALCTALPRFLTTDPSTPLAASSPQAVREMNRST
ncbi:hypothetical protein OHB12_01010 [Nocardia sp. NBC_01730]|uniref:hypothetical protein n=1 Tax=Nocardia sp. NBC_01730 TaxID=2975998 RepID=UPI002E11DC33|nr:hypothetical protein OHB12_01010 [Nocardia sp. NBC_01730]